MHVSCSLSLGLRSVGTCILMSMGLTIRHNSQEVAPVGMIINDTNTNFLIVCVTPQNYVDSYLSEHGTGQARLM